uniref:Peripheral subunit-binding (PSBD) domain-containing protein n=1 Tax=Panagrellus redivivus TaxID=6233 RepID=A0A7E4VEM0_PANRE
MGYVDLEAAYKTDSALITSRVRATIKQAMNLENRVLMLTTMKLDFSDGQLLVGEIPGFIYRSPEVKIETIPLCPVEPIVESNATTTSSKHRRQPAGADVYEQSPARSVRSSLSLLKEYAPFLKAECRALPSAVPRAVIHEFLDGQKIDVKEVAVPNPPVEEVGHMTAKDIMKWIEDGEKLTRKKRSPPPPPAPEEPIQQKELPPPPPPAPAEPLQQKELPPPPLPEEPIKQKELPPPPPPPPAELIIEQKQIPPPPPPEEPVQKVLEKPEPVVSLVSTVESNPGEREIADQASLTPKPVKSDDTLHSVASLATVAATTQTEDPPNKAPFRDGPIGSVEEFPAGIGCMMKIIQCGHPNIRGDAKLL